MIHCESSCFLACWVGCGVIDWPTSRLRSPHPPPPVELHFPPRAAVATTTAQQQLIRGRQSLAAPLGTIVVRGRGVGFPTGPTGTL